VAGNDCHAPQVDGQKLHVLGMNEIIFRILDSFCIKKVSILRFLVVLKAQNLHMCTKIRVFGKIFF
jgi:hypothetical protein